GYSRDLQAFNTVGYKQVIQFLDEELSREQMVKGIKTATRRYAKRQITWLRRWPFVEWIDVSKTTRDSAIKKILSV
ncbi:MAG: tRNA (adenosine(37)-N6)-dimethylallyltransferase MiaA, partial [Balneolaceae bacterium]|nr:tRNA (adenosine(37)-N6)-dimethylallyltransferase MiaA [Balneolaceae bacterium]